LTPGDIRGRLIAALDHFFSAVGKYQPGCALPQRDAPRQRNAAEVSRGPRREEQGRHKGDR